MAFFLGGCLVMVYVLFSSKGFISFIIASFHFRSLLACAKILGSSSEVMDAKKAHWLLENLLYESYWEKEREDISYESLIRERVRNLKRWWQVSDIFFQMFRLKSNLGTMSKRLTLIIGPIISQWFWSTVIRSLTIYRGFWIIVAWSLCLIINFCIVIPIFVGLFIWAAFNQGSE